MLLKLRERTLETQLEKTTDELASLKLRQQELELQLSQAQERANEAEVSWTLALFGNTCRYEILSSPAVMVQ